MKLVMTLKEAPHISHETFAVEIVNMCDRRLANRIKPLFLALSVFELGCCDPSQGVVQHPSISLAFE